MSSPTIPNPILRRACDRCHSQKLSCHRNDSGACARCVKADATCTSSPSLRNQNRRGKPSPIPRQFVPDPVPDPIPVGHEDFPLRSSRHADGERSRPAARSTLNVGIAGDISNTASKRFHEATREPLHESLQIHIEGYHRPTVQNDTETLDWMDRATTHTLRGLTKVDDNSQSAASSTIDWESSTSAFLTADLHFPSPPQTSATMPENSNCILQRLGIMTPSMNLAISKGGCDILFDQRRYAASSELSDTDTDIGSASASTFGSTPASMTTTLPSHPSLELSLADRIAPLPIPMPSQEHPPRSISQTDSQWLEKLVEINVKLFNHAKRALNWTSLSTSSLDSTNANEDLACDTSQPCNSNSFDESLILSLQFIKALRKFHTTTSRDLRIHTTAASPASLDPGTTLIIYSCYIRILELYIDRLDAIRQTFNATTAALSTQHSSGNSSPATSSVPPMNLPTLAACSCSLEDFPTLHLRMTLELVEEILDVTSGLVLSITRGPGGTQRQEEDLAMPWRRQSVIPDVSHQALLTREEAAYRIIRDIRRGLKASRRAMI